MMNTGAVQIFRHPCHQLRVTTAAPCGSVVQVWLKNRQRSGSCGKDFPACCGLAQRLDAEANRYVDRNDRNAPQTEAKLREYGRALRNIAVPMLLNPEERLKFMRLAIHHGMADLKTLI